MSSDFLMHPLCCAGSQELSSAFFCSSSLSPQATQGYPWHPPTPYIKEMLASLLGFVVYHRQTKNIKTNWDSWKNKSDKLALMAPEETFMPLARTAARLSCKCRESEMQSVPKAVLTTPQSSTDEGSTASCLPSAQQRKKR